MDVGQLLVILGGSGFVGFIGVILSGRTGRQREFDARVDKELTRVREELEQAEAERDRYREENTRLRVLCRSHGINPDSDPRSAS